MNEVRILCVTAALLLGSPVIAGTNETATAELGPMVVSARGRGVGAETLPGSAAVAEAGAIKAGFAGAPELAATVPGAWVVTDGAWASDVSLRGLSRESVVMLVDGCRLNTANDIAGRFSLVAPLSIERIEVLQGPISALYGSGSLGGVVNALTHTGRFQDEVGFDAGMSGSYDSASGGVAGYAFGSWNGPSGYLYAGQSARSYSDYTDGAGDDVHNSGFRDRQTLVRGAWLVAPGWTLEAGFQRADADEVGIPGSGTAPLPAAADVTYEHAERTLAMVSVACEPGGMWERTRLLLYGHQMERLVRIDAFPVASPVDEIRPEAEHWTRGARWDNTLSPGGGHTVSAGLDAWEWSLESARERILKNGTVLNDEPLPESRMLSFGAFAEDDWELGRLTLNTGGRYDAIEVSNEPNATWEERDDSDTVWSAHAGATCRLTGSLTAKAVVAAGYRTASLSERYQYLELGGGQKKFGNPDLRPEKSLLSEIGLVWRGRTVTCGASIFRNAVDDMIGEVREDPTTLRAANVDEAEFFGGEAQARWTPAPWTEFFATFAYVTGREPDSGEFLPGVPPFGGTAGVRYATPAGWWLDLRTRFAAAQDEAPTGEEDAPGWQTFDVTSGRDFRGGANSVYVGVKNLADAEYRQYLATSRGVEYLEPGRSIVAGFAARF